MTMDTFINLFGLALSMGGLLAAKLTRQMWLALFAFSLGITTGAASWLALQHDREIRRAEAELSKRLAFNRWTLEQIHSEMRDPDDAVLHEALDRGIDKGAVDSQLIACTVSDGSVLTARVYFATPH